MSKKEPTSQSIAAAAGTPASATEPDGCGDIWHDAPSEPTQDTPWGNLDWERELLEERKYICPKSRLRDLITKQKCQQEGCVQSIDTTTITEREIPSGICFDFKCKVII